MQSTVVTATAPPSTSVKVELGATSLDEHSFFWSYSEEPHRTRRQAIIKVHPEVISHDPFLFLPPNRFLGDKALWTRTMDQVSRSHGLWAAIDLRRLPAEHTCVVCAISLDCLCHWRHGQPEPLSIHTRDLAQPSLSGPYRQ